MNRSWVQTFLVFDRQAKPANQTNVCDNGACKVTVVED